MLKGNKLYSIFKGKCPVCHTGDMYVEKNPYKISTTLEMHERCPHCNTKFKIEPSFFYGAMYVSYGVGIAFATAAFTISYGMLELGLTPTFIIIIATLIVFLPIITRISRNIWINFFFKYDKSKV
ncbi:MAG: DUF983 domain-containing protein [Patiriisocius sp.]|uniref:DUF983 domain-containing protein n=1 Tax=Patiriisocius sp. TaxID=2822396 RepID=UPI003EF3977F